jgi:hypothetical protein
LPKWGAKKMKTVFLLSYGCDLDHYNIDFLVKERLMPFAKTRIKDSWTWQQRGCHLIQLTTYKKAGRRHSLLRTVRVSSDSRRNENEVEMKSAYDQNR